MSNEEERMMEEAIQSAENSIAFLLKGIQDYVGYASNDIHRLLEIRDVLLVAYGDINGNAGGIATLGVSEKTMEWLRSKF